MDTRITHRVYVRPQLVAVGRVEVETRGPAGDYVEIEMEKNIPF